MNPEELAAQLACPNGEFGVEVGNSMYQGNKNMIDNCIKALKLKNDFSILELGFGNGQHISGLHTLAENIKYTGTETSELMLNEAKRNNDYLPHNAFILSDGSVELPFFDGSFDAFFSSNTVYFWSDIKSQLTEIYRVLKFGGQLSLSFVEKQFGQTLSFTAFGFNLYSDSEMLTLLQTTGFTAIDFLPYSEEIKSKDGTLVNRVYWVVKAKKA